MDLLVWGERHGVPPDELATMADVTPEAIVAAYAEIVRRRDATGYLHAPAIVADAPPAL